MARRKSAPRGRTSERRGGTLFSVMAGIVLGLLAAAAVAIYITGAPMPFVDRASRGPDPVPGLPQSLPDPNRGLSSAGIKPPPPSLIVPTPATPGAGQSADPGPGPATPDVLGAFVANLGNGVNGAGAGQGASAVAPSTNPPPIPTVPAGRYILQVGAFRVIEDAEALKARLALLGFEARVSQALVNGALVNRVQVGPYANLQSMNQARERLTANQVESSVLRN